MATPLELADNCGSPCKDVINHIYLPSIKFHPEVCKIRCKIFLEAGVILPNFVATTQLLWKAIVVVLESSTKFILSNCISLTHFKTRNNFNTSPTSTRHKRVKHMVLANTTLYSSHKHMPISVLFNPPFNFIYDGRSILSIQFWSSNYYNVLNHSMCS